MYDHSLKLKVNKKIMLENLPKNGSFVERRKVFVQFPFHSLNHHLPFNWTGQDRSSQEKKRMLNQSLEEHQRIKQTYDMKIQMKMRQKYRKKVDTFRVIPNQITYKQDQEALAKELENFNHAKVTPTTNPQLPQHPSSPLKYNYQSATQLNNKPRPDSKNHSLYARAEKDYHRESSLAQNHHPNHQQHQSNLLQQSRFDVDQYRQRMQELERYRSPYRLKNSYGPNALPQFRKFANLSNSTELHPIEIPTVPVRNYLPDQLQGFLRERSKLEERKHPLKLSLSTSKRPA